MSAAVIKCQKSVILLTQHFKMFNLRFLVPGFVTSTLFPHHPISAVLFAAAAAACLFVYVCCFYCWQLAWILINYVDNWFVDNCSIVQLLMAWICNYLCAIVAYNCWWQLLTIIKLLMAWICNYLFKIGSLESKERPGIDLSLWSHFFFYAYHIQACAEFIFWMSDRRKMSFHIHHLHNPPPTRKCRKAWSSSPCCE